MKSTRTSSTAHPSSAPASSARRARRARPAPALPVRGGAHELSPSARLLLDTLAARHLTSDEQGRWRVRDPEALMAGLRQWGSEDWAREVYGVVEAVAAEQALRPVAVFPI